MHSQVRGAFGHKPRTHRKQARQQFLAVAKKKKPRINKIRKAIRQQLGHLKRNLTSIDALTACGAGLLAAGRYVYENLLVVSELLPPLPAKLTPLHFDHQGGLMEQSNASLQRGRQG
jgi:transposase, IS5 family